MLALNYKKKAEPKNGYKEFPVDDNKDIEHNIRSWILAMFSVLSVTTYPIFFLYFQNADEVSFNEVAVPLFIFIASGLVLFSMFLLLSKDVNKSAVITNLFMLVLMNYVLLEKGVQVIIPTLHYWHILLIFLFILAHIAWFICKNVSKELAKTAVLVMFIVFGGLIALNGVVSTPVIINKISIEKQLNEQKNSIKQMSSHNVENPNIYYLIFDEYSSIDFMKKYYNYDNSAFTNYLDELGFNISYTSHNESIMTSTVATNLVNLDYVVNNDMPEAEKAYYRKNNFLFRYLNEKNYKITGVGIAEFYGLNNAASNELDLNAKTIDGKIMADIIFEKTVFKPFYRIPSYTKAEKEILEAFEFLKKQDTFSKNSFTFSHVVCPHGPFYFNKNGEPYNIPAENWREPKYYLEQYIFTTNQIIEIVDLIIENDPESCIIIQSDHSARASADREIFMEKFSLEDMSNIFNAVYFKGEKLTIEGLSGVNTLRILFNKMFDENFEIIEVPIDNYKYK